MADTPLKPYRILVVDDDPANRELISTIIAENLAVNVDTAAGGTEALDKHRAQPFDLVVTDNIMRNSMSGIELARTFRAANENKPGIILISANDMAQDEAVKIGVQAFIAKPPTIDTLIRTVEKVLAEDVPAVARKKILIVEDFEAIRHATARVAKSFNLAVFEAENGKMGLEIAQRENPEIVITDLSMPLMRGDEMIRAIRADKTIRQPFIVATSGDDEGRYLIQLGANMFLLKPYQPAQAIQQGLDSLEPKHA